MCSQHPSFAKNAKDGTLHSVADASEIKKPGHPPSVGSSVLTERGYLRVVVRDSREERAHLDRHPTGDDSLAPPRQCLIQVRAFQQPKTAYVLLGLQVRPVGDEHLATGLRSQRPRTAGRGEAASENPGTGGRYLFVEHVIIAHHRFAFEGPVVTVGVVNRN